MAYCPQCGRAITWWRRIFQTMFGRPESDGHRFCSHFCMSKYEVSIKREAEEQQANREEEARKAEELWEQHKEELQRRFETKKQSLLEAIERAPRDSMNYFRLGNFLIKQSGFNDYLHKIDPFRLWHGYWGDWIQSSFYLSIFIREFNNLELNSVESLQEREARELRAEQEFIDRLKTQRPLLIEARDAYFNAIALNSFSDPFISACTKLNYAIISILVSLRWFDHDVALEPDYGGCDYYAREAEKDLRKFLRKEPDDVEALQKLALAIALYQKSDKAREQRLNSVSARIKEAEARKRLQARPPVGLRPPGAPESPYPENWSEVAETIRKRDSYQCTQCNATDVELHVHHVVPLSKGGSNEFDNLVTLCDYCHREAHSSRE